MNTAITIPKIEATPKPTKAQLIEALVEREAKIHEESQESLKQQRDALIQQAEDLGWKDLATKERGDYDVRVESYYGYVKFSVVITSNKLNFILNKLEAVKEKIGIFNKANAKKVITAKLAGAKKENPLLNNPQFNDSLDSILTQIKGAPLAITTHEVETTK